MMNRMSRRNNDQGRAYEFVCLHSLQEAINALRPAKINDNSSYEAAKTAWDTLSEAEKALYTLSAKSTIDVIFAMEPKIIEVNDDPVILYIQSDQRGEEADVRDIIIQRHDIKWEIGLSIKHNHMAVKHSRLAKALDFGDKWYGKACSQSYWDEVKPVFDFLEAESQERKFFRNLRSKEDEVYVPLLKAFMSEVKRQVESDSTIPRKIVEYLLSKYDFYKVISIDSRRITTIQSFNMYGTLNQPSKQTNPTIEVPTIELPTTLLHIGFKPKSKTTIIMCFDNGWQFSFRIHNAKSLIEASLKFDIQIKGMPADVNVKFNCKW